MCSPHTQQLHEAQLLLFTQSQVNFCVAPSLLRLSSCLSVRPVLPVPVPACTPQGHLARVGEERCAFVRPMVFANKAMASRTHMEAQVGGRQQQQQYEVQQWAVC
jgi:hypothetical protein